MPRLLLHIGTHKTGTTSIQRFCNANRAALRERGVWYPPVDLGKFPGHYAHHRVAHAIAGVDPTFGPRHATDFFHRVRKKLGSSETALVSAEPFYRHTLAGPEVDDDPRPGAERLQADFVRYAEEVRRCIGDLDVTVLVMLRRQDLFLESLYAEQVLATAYTRSVDAFERGRRHLLDFDARLQGWAQAFGENNVRICPFDPAGWGVTIERAFLDWIEVEWSGRFVVGERRNVTPPRAFIEYKRLINVVGQPVPVTRAYRQWLEQLSESMPTDDIPDLGRFYLSADQRNEVLERFAAGNRNVAERFHGGRPLFDTTLSSEHLGADLPRSLTFDEFGALSRLLFRQIADERFS